MRMCKSLFKPYCGNLFLAGLERVMAALPWWVWTMAILILTIVVIGCWKTEALRTRKRYRVAWSRGETGDPIRDMI